MLVYTSNKIYLAYLIEKKGWERPGEQIGPRAHWNQLSLLVLKQNKMPLHVPKIINLMKDFFFKEKVCCNLLTSALHVVLISIKKR